MKPYEIKILQDQNRERILPLEPMILIGMGTCGIGNGADTVYRHLINQIESEGADCKLKQTGCFGFCSQEPLVMLYKPGKPMLAYCKVHEKDIKRIIESIKSESTLNSGNFKFKKVIR